MRVKCPKTWAHGMECLITDGPNHGLISVAPSDAPRLATYYETDIRSRAVPGDLCCFEPHELIPITDDDDKASWETIEKLTNWNPAAVTVT